MAPFGRFHAAGFRPSATIVAPFDRFLNKRQSNRAASARSRKGRSHRNGKCSTGIVNTCARW